MQVVTAVVEASEHNWTAHNVRTHRAAVLKLSVALNVQLLEEMVEVVLTGLFSCIW
jgi:expansin (peptidoglycan-binding protein)